ncbi:hypothetical protein BJ508DRAFT_332887 [Ascobolus immersus RN42]|uniref:Uncharacterized protein n=1 Tax=Ascobolus immersus RN42 TaxID=1160509 RepID=A0A3N4HRC8_ASCIM|nr:hypothetical protein BJ508DRAFT_332887 [Ascobolus immersus RN42]
MSDKKKERINTDDIIKIGTAQHEETGIGHTSPNDNHTSLNDNHTSPNDNHISPNDNHISSYVGQPIEDEEVPESMVDAGQTTTPGKNKRAWEQVETIDKDETSTPSTESPPSGQRKRLSLYNFRTGEAENPTTIIPLSTPGLFPRNFELGCTEPSQIPRLTAGIALSEGRANAVFIWDTNDLEHLPYFLPRRGHSHTYFMKTGHSPKGEYGVQLFARRMVSGERMPVFGGWVRKNSDKYHGIVGLLESGVFVSCVVYWSRKYFWNRKGCYGWEGSVHWKAYCSEDDDESTFDEYTEGNGSSDEGSDDEEW